MHPAGACQASPDNAAYPAWQHSTELHRGRQATLLRTQASSCSNMPAAGCHRSPVVVGHRQSPAVADALISMSSRKPCVAVMHRVHQRHCHAPKELLQTASPAVEARRQTPAAAVTFDIRCGAAVMTPVRRCQQRFRSNRSPQLKTTSPAGERHHTPAAATTCVIKVSIAFVLYAQCHWCCHMQILMPSASLGVTCCGVPPMPRPRPAMPPKPCGRAHAGCHQSCTMTCPTPGWPRLLR